MVLAEEVKALIGSERDALAGILLIAARRALGELQISDRFAFDLGEGLREVCGKVGDGEFVRDRPTSGVLSALYEGPAKWSAALEAVLGQLEKDSSSQVKILDLGFGCAAPAVAAAVAATHWSKLSAREMPQMQVHIVDSSPFVLRFLQDYLWPEVTAEYPGAAMVELTFDHNTCVLDANGNDDDLWVFAGYLFDHVNHREGFIQEFADAIEIRQPGHVFVIGPAGNAEGVSVLRDELRVAEYVAVFQELGALRGGVTGAGDLHQELMGAAEGVVRLLDAPSWSDPEIFLLKCTHEGSRQLTLDRGVAAPWDMYTAKLRDRNSVKLNDRQKEAATWSGKVRPTCISGPAGSGKSLVLTERLANLVRKPPRETGLEPFDPNFRILFTTFNKELTVELKKWIGEVLGKHARWGGGGFHFGDSPIMNVRLLHFDVIPTRIGRYSNRGSRLLSAGAASSIERAILKVKEELELKPSDYRDILHADYIEEEFDRIFYGMELKSLREYQTVARKGRGQKGGGPDQRRIVGRVMGEWMRQCHEDKSYTFRMVRRMFLNDLKDGRHRPMFTDIFVDEFQDCTPADFSIFYRLLKDSNRLIVAGDLAQSVHLGNTAAMPRDRIDEGDDQRNFRRIFLKGSYRLPLHISLCLQGLSKAIQGRQKEGEIMSPYEGAPPGVRLLFISAESSLDMARKIVAVMTTYAPYRKRLLGEGADERAVIMESDKDLAREVNKLRPNSVTSDTILRLKGLEKSMVIWSTRQQHQSEDDALEFVYTILTRSSGIGVIAHFDDETTDAYHNVLNTLDHALLLPWDARSREVLLNMKKETLNDEELAF